MILWEGVIVFNTMDNIMNILFTEYPGVFGIEHILYLVICLLMMFTGWFIIAKYVKAEKTKTLIVKISAFALLCAILWNRISITIYNFKNNEDGLRNLLYLIPLSFCGFSSLVNALATLFLKKDNKILHCISYLGLIGGVISIIYPDYLEEQTFFDPRTLSGLLHHTIMIWVIITNMITGYFTPQAKKWYIYPLGLCLIMGYGLFFKEVTGLGAMQIGSPLLSSAPIFTSWYVVGVLTMFIHLAIIIGFEKGKAKKTWKEIFSKENWMTK